MPCRPVGYWAVPARARASPLAIFRGGIEPGRQDRTIIRRNHLLPTVPLPLYAVRYFQYFLGPSSLFPIYSLLPLRFYPLSRLL